MNDDLSTEPALATDRPTGRRRGDRIVGGGRAMRDAVELAKAAARSEHPVHLVGPEGSGREHLARAIHAWSSRASGPCVVVACGGLAAARAARDLFGTSAAGEGSSEPSPGVFGRAAGGTLILSAFDQLPEASREAVRQACAEGRYRREGDGASAPQRARVIVTSLNGSLRRPPFGDLPHHEIAVPPLSERREDVLALAAHFLRLASEDEGFRPVGFTSDARAALLAEPWPGNVRELAERVRQAVRLAGDGAISAEALLLSADGENVPSFKEAKRAFETRYVVGLLRRCGGNISRAARLAKKDRKDFYDVIRRTGVNPADFR